MNTINSRTHSRFPINNGVLKELVLDISIPTNNQEIKNGTFEGPIGIKIDIYLTSPPSPSSTSKNLKIKTLSTKPLPYKVEYTIKKIEGIKLIKNDYNIKAVCKQMDMTEKYLLYYVDELKNFILTNQTPPIFIEISHIHQIIY